MLSYIALAALFSRARSQCSADSDCPLFGFACDTVNDQCYPACSVDADCNAIWGYEGATCDSSGDVSVCTPGDSLLSACTEDADCGDGFSCFDASSLTGVDNFCYPGCTDQSDCDAIPYGECVSVDYVVFGPVDICTASPSNYACDTDDDCGDLKCFGSGPASLCYVGCDTNDDCSDTYECVTDVFGFNACRPANVDITCTTDADCAGALDGFTCLGGGCAPACTEGDDAGCEALTGAGSFCRTMDNGTGEKLSFCDDSAVSTDPATTTEEPVDCTMDSECPLYGFKCDVINGMCYPACDTDEDCNAIWGYEGATCDSSGDVSVCSPGDSLLSACTEDADCGDGFSCFDASGLSAYGVDNFCYPGCTEQADCDAIPYGECVTVDYVLFEADICTASPSNYACDTDDDCDGDLKCFGSGPASLCYVGCDGNNDCSEGYECVTDVFGFSACRVSGLDITCSDSSPCSGDLAAFTCLGGGCVPACSVDADCEAFFGADAGSVCVTMDNGLGEKLSFCDDSAISTGGDRTTTTETPIETTTTETPTGGCTADSDCPLYGFKCNVDSAVCYPACSEAADCNAIWGYEGSTCNDDSTCEPFALPLTTCTDAGDCPAGFSCFDVSGLSYLEDNFCYPGCTEQADCDTIQAATNFSSSCVTVDYVVFEADICTASPTNYACDTDDDCEGDLKCFGSGPASLCYVGCDSDDDCSTGGDVDYECATDVFGLSACRPVGVDITCTTDADCSGALENFTCVGNGCAPLCTEGDDATCETLTGTGSVCLTMDNGAGQKLSFCDDSAVSTVAEPTMAPTTAGDGNAAASMATVAALAAASMALIAQ